MKITTKKYFFTISLIIVLVLVGYIILSNMLKIKDRTNTGREDFIKIMESGMRTNNIVIKNGQAFPDKAIFLKDENVTWINLDNESHDIVSIPVSTRINGGENLSFTLSETGLWTYRIDRDLALILVLTQRDFREYHCYKSVAGENIYYAYKNESFFNPTELQQFTECLKNI